jgi:branched-chain amino acid transport system permease protein
MTALRQRRSSLGERLPPHAGLVAFLALVLIVPFISFFDDPWLRVFVLVGIYVVLGLGLNVVVGYAGLLDLGFVAFFAVGAYTMAIFSAPGGAIAYTLDFWIILPLAVVLGATAGVLLGLPVLPLRGDYLAIVTLGFGEIFRIFITNRADLTEGSQGISAIAEPSLVFRDIDDSTAWYYFVFVMAIAVAFVTRRIRDARVGRAWEAIREDEDVAAAMGINTTRYKLMAFATGAGIGALGGVLFASRIGFINPSAFTLLISVNVLAIVIIGGMGSTPGVIVGAFILIGLPDILQFSETADLLGNLGWLRDGINTGLDGINALSPWDFSKLPPAEEWGRWLADKRFIIFGALLVLVMILRPEGIFPSRRRQMEFANPTEADPGPGAV